MSLSVEELMIPRYMLIANYPGNDLPIGTIYTTDSKAWIWSNLRLAPKNIKDYPANFRKMEWWEGRREEDMPKYIKHADSLYRMDEVIEVIDWHMDEEIPCFQDNSVMGTWVRGFLPATEAEYLTYKQHNP